MPLREGQLELDLYPVDDGAPEPGTRERNRKRPRSEAQPAVEAIHVAGVDRSALLTTQEAAAVLHVHPRTVQRLVERGELSAVRLGSAVRFDPFDVGSFIDRLKRCGKSAEADVADSVRARKGAGVSFADRLRSQTA